MNKVVLISFIIQKEYLRLKVNELVKIEIKELSIYRLKIFRDYFYV